jgi:hypothetical protein
MERSAIPDIHHRKSRLRLTKCYECDPSDIDWAAKPAGRQAIFERAQGEPAG